MVGAEVDAGLHGREPTDQALEDAVLGAADLAGMKNFVRGAEEASRGNVVAGALLMASSAPMPAVRGAGAIRVAAKIADKAGDVARAGGPLRNAAKAGAGAADDALVCRGGSCTAERFVQGSGVSLDKAGKLQGVSVNSAPGASLEKLTSTIPNKQVGVTTVGKIRQAGGTVTPSPTTNNPTHCTMCGITPTQAEKLFRPTVPNPNP